MKHEKPRSNLQPYHKPKLPGRNDRCPCDSGKKAKKCCLDNIKALAALPPHLRQQILVANILRQPVGITPPEAPKTVPLGAGIITTGEGLEVPIESGEIIVSNTIPEAI